MLHQNLKFQTLDAIPSPDLRRRIHHTIDEINRIIKETEGYPPKEHVVTIVNRFFRYLTQTCEQRSSVIRRANWILTYAVCTLEILEGYRGQVIQYSTESYLNIRHADLIEKIVTISTLVQEYVQRLDPESIDLIETQMAEIMAQSAKLKPAQSEAYYATLDRCGDFIIANLKRVCGDPSAAKIVLDRNQLLNDLSAFLYRLRNYRTRVG